MGREPVKKRVAMRVTGTEMGFDSAYNKGEGINPNHNAHVTSPNYGREVLGGVMGKMKKKIGSLSGGHSAKEEAMDNVIAKARGQRAYYERGRGKNKAAVAARMAGR